MRLYPIIDFRIQANRNFRWVLIVTLHLSYPFVLKAQVQPSPDSVKLQKDGREVLRSDSVDFENKFIESELEKVQYERYSESLKREALRKLLENQQLQNATLQQKLQNEQLKSESVQKAIEANRRIALAKEEQEKQQKRIQQLEIEKLGQQLTSQRKSRNYLVLGLSGLAMFGVFLIVTNRKLLRRSRRIQELSTSNLQKEMEKQAILSSQNELLEKQVAERTDELRSTIHHLRDTQDQLIRAEKLASLGELTAGIAHEIQNPLNFVNNFTEVSVDLVREMVEEADKGNNQEVRHIAEDLAGNLERIHHHGGRASAIVKGMLQHSRGSTGTKELTDINVFCQRFVQLARNTLHSRHPGFEVRYIENYDPGMGQVAIIQQELGQVLVNLVSNAHYAVMERAQKNPHPGYQPAINITTEKKAGKLVISVKDNGTGIPAQVRGKVFQPFFTTKPTGQGTGLGLSLSYDTVVKGHGGELLLESTPGEGAEFRIEVPTP